MMYKQPICFFLLIIIFLAVASCTTKNIATTSSGNVSDAVIDRFTNMATLFKRSVYPQLPATNQPINFDTLPFFSIGIDTAGNTVATFNFDAWSPNRLTDTAYIIAAPYQTNYIIIFDIIFRNIPGSPLYNDIKASHLYYINKDSAYIIGSIRSYTDIQNALTQKKIIDMGARRAIINIPIVPKNSIMAQQTANPYWYNGQQVYGFFLNDIFQSVNNQFPIKAIDTAWLCFNQNPSAMYTNTLDTLAKLMLQVGYKTNTNKETKNMFYKTNPNDTLYSSFRTAIVYNNSFFFDYFNYNTIFLSGFITYPILSNGFLLNMPTIPVQISTIANRATSTLLKQPFSPHPIVRNIFF